MKKQVSPKLVALAFGILVIIFLAGFYIFAWQEPTVAPPGGNVAAPLNVGGTTQYKTGALGVGGVLQANSQFCLGGVCKSAWPAEGGTVTTYRMTAQASQSGGTYYAQSKSYDCPEGATPNVSLVPTGTYSCQSFRTDDDAMPFCFYGTSGRTITLTSSVIESLCSGGGLIGDCTGCFYASPCTPGGDYSDSWACHISGTSCAIEFTCGQKITVP